MTLVWIVLIPAFQFIPCSSRDLCSGTVIEDSWQALDDYRDNPIQILYSILLAILTYMINIGGVSITRYGSAAQRTTVNISANVFIWLFFLFIPVNGSPIERFLVLQLVGFLILLLGVLLYNEILVLPFWGFNRYTQSALKER